MKKPTRLPLLSNLCSLHIECLDLEERVQAKIHQYASWPDEWRNTKHLHTAIWWLKTLEHTDNALGELELLLLTANRRGSKLERLTKAGGLAASNKAGKEHIEGAIDALRQLRDKMRESTDKETIWQVLNRLTDAHRHLRNP